MTALPHRVVPAHSSLHISTTASRPTDPALTAVLLAKPIADDVPLAVWWFLAESLRHSVSVRRATEGVEILGAAALCKQVRRAAMYAEAALEELDQLAPDSLPIDATHWRRPAVPNGAALRMTICALARLVVRTRSVTTVQLRATILAHLHALRLVAE